MTKQDYDFDRTISHSVIVPVYNAQKTIGRCLDTILVAASSTSEVIVVNDGSTDDTAQILAEYSARNKQIHVITQENMGVSAARNKGINASSGYIVSFVDSDDYVSPHYFELIEEVFRQSQADVVFFEYARVKDDGLVISHHALPGKTADKFENLMRLSEADMFGYTWCKAFRRDVLANILFDESMNLFEDEVFTANALIKPMNIEYLSKELYFYVCNDNESLSRKSNENYQIYCDKVYLAWKRLLGNSLNSVDFLQNKANHFANVCKYYGLERVWKSIEFF